LVDIALIECHIKLGLDLTRRTLAIARNFENSAEPLLSNPSAMFDMMETEARRI
jgi:hypothetical protein